MILRICVALALIAVTVFLSIEGDVRARDDSPHPLTSEPTQLLVRLADGATTPAVRGLAHASASTYNSSLNVWRFDLQPGVSVEAALAELEDDPTVEFAQPNYVYHASHGPDDPEFQRIQHPYYAAVNAEAGWSMETGSEDVVVAVLDAGVDAGHPELDSKIWRNAAESENGSDDDGNGCIDDVNGCDFLSDPPGGDITDISGHGTFVSGIIAAETNNGEGVAGLAWGTTIMPVRVLDENGAGTTEQLAAGILYAARNGADVENMSLSLTPEAGVCPSDQLVEEALREAHDDYGVVIVAAAGNDGVGCVSFPAASQYTIGVGGSSGASDPDRRAFFSQWGPEIDVAAPAIDIYSTMPEASFGSNSGTSFATPFVAGLSALLLSQDTTRTADDVRDIIRETARNLPDDGFPNWDGAGLIDIGAALGSGSTFVALDVSAPTISELELRLQVGVEASVECEATLWDTPSVEGTAIHGSFGAGECAEFWPPSPARPWRLTASYTGPKAAVVNSVGVINGGASCAARDLPSVVPPIESSVSTIDCAAEDLVANDDPAHAATIDLSLLSRTLRQDVQYATSAGDPTSSCASEFSRSVWFRLPAADAPKAVVVDTFGSDFDTVIVAFTGELGALSEVGCGDDFDSPQSRLVIQLDAASDTYLMVAAFQQVPAGQLRLNVNEASVPANDSFAAAQEITVSGSSQLVQAAHSATATSEDPTLSCAPAYGFSLWFKVTADSDEVLAADTAGSTYDTVIGVYESVQGDLAEVACNDDTAPGQRTSRIAWDAIAGREYYVMVGAFAKRSAGALRLSIAPDGD